MECFIDVSQFKFVNNIVQVIYILADLLSRFLFIIWSRVLTSPTMIVVSISPFSSISFCLVHFGALLSCAYRFIIVIDSWSIYTFIIMKYPPLTLIILFCLKVYFFRY